MQDKTAEPVQPPIAVESSPETKNANDHAKNEAAEQEKDVNKGAENPNPVENVQNVTEEKKDTEAA